MCDVLDALIERNCLSDRSILGLCTLCMCASHVRSELYYWTRERHTQRIVWKSFCGYFFRTSDIRFFTVLHILNQMNHLLVRSLFLSLQPAVSRVCVLHVFRLNNKHMHYYYFFFFSKIKKKMNKLKHLYGVEEKVYAALHSAWFWFDLCACCLVTFSPSHTLCTVSHLTSFCVLFLLLPFVCLSLSLEQHTHPLNAYSISVCCTGDAVESYSLVHCSWNGAHTQWHALSWSSFILSKWLKGLKLNENYYVTFFPICSFRKIRLNMCVRMWVRVVAYRQLHGDFYVVAVSIQIQI